MNRTTHSRPTNWPVRHAILILALLLIVPAIPALARWPWGLLFPVGTYAAIVVAVRPLRESLDWLRVGKLDRNTWRVTAMFALISVAGLTVWYLIFRPDLSAFTHLIPSGPPLTLLMAGLVFASVNAVMEEVICRGIWMEALTVSYGPKFALILQALIFGVMHANGIPPGSVGILMAAVFGGMLGWLRQRTGGLLAPCLVHFAADITIFTLVTLSR